MKLKQILKIQEVLGNKIPVDMYSNMRYYSDSRDEWIDIMDLDIVHAIRILRKHVGTERDYAEERTAMYYDNDGTNI
jgi:hypothetical protein